MIRKWYILPAMEDEEDGGGIPNFHPLEVPPAVAYAQQIDDETFYVLIYDDIPYQEATREQVEAAGINYDRTVSGGPE